MEPMRIQEDLSFAAPLERVQAMLLDPTYRERVLAAQKVVRGSVRVADEDGVTVVEVEQTQATDGVPSFVRKLTGDEITITQVERWTSPLLAEVTSSIPGAPGSVTGTNELVGGEGSATLRVVREITVKVPLVGGKLAQFVASMHTKALAKEYAVAKEWLGL